MRNQKSNTIDRILWFLLIIIIILYLKECCSSISFLIKHKRQTDTIYVTKPKIVDIIADSALVSELRKIFKKTDTFKIIKYIPITVKVKDTLLIPVISTQTLVLKTKDTVCFKTINEFRKANKDSSLIYGFTVKTDACVIKDSLLEEKQQIERFDFSTSLKLYEVQRVKKYGFDETLIAVWHPKEMKIEVSPYAVRVRKKRLGLGCFVGVGYDLLKLKPIPVIGLGVSYNAIMIR